MSMPSPISARRCLAFAGLLQALELVQRAAYGKTRDPVAESAVIGAVFALDADSVETVYGGAGKLATGLRLLIEQLNAGSGNPDAELSRYLITLLVLERKISRQPVMLERLRTGIEALTGRFETGGPDDPEVLAELARLYSETVSKLQPRVMVQGEPTRLNDPATADGIRALLLSAIRSAVLWRQLGGSRIGLLFSRGKLIGDARQWLIAIEAEFRNP